MERVVTINLNGNAYQLDESAFAALRAYLDEAGNRLKNNPDRSEILTDLEQAIAEKCSRFIGPHKNVVSAAEIDQVLKEMGPVESPEGSGEATASGATPPPRSDAGPQTKERPGPKRLYRIREGAMFMGVCNGIAAYLHIDVVFVRIAAVVSVFVTFGWAWLGYWILGFIIPEARTADEHAAGHGQAPFNAQDVIDEARRATESFKTQAAATGREVRRQAREQHREWRRQTRAWRQQWRASAWSGRPFAASAAAAGAANAAAAGAAGAPTMPVPPAMFAPAMWGTPFLPLLSMVSFIGFVALVLSLISLVGTGSLWGWPLPHGMPIWVGVVLLAAMFHVFTLPLRAARRAYRHGWNWHYAWLATWDSLVGFVFLAFGIWLFFRHMPPTDNFHDFVRNVPDALRGAGHEVLDWIRRLAEEIRRLV